MGDPGRGTARAAGREDAGQLSHGDQAAPPGGTLVTPACYCSKGLTAGDAAGRGRGAGTRQAPGKATLGGCGPPEGKKADASRASSPPRRRDFLLGEPALRPGEGR